MSPAPGPTSPPGASLRRRQRGVFRIGVAGLGLVLLGCPGGARPSAPCGDAVCRPAARCIRESAGPRCRLQCTRDSACPAGEICSPLADGGRVCRPAPPPCSGPLGRCPGSGTCQPWLRHGAWSWRCLAPGRAPLGAACDRACARGALCVRATRTATRGVCRRPCTRQRDCAPPGQCVLYVPELEVRVCDPSVNER